MIMHSENIDQLFTALGELQFEMGPVPRTGKVEIWNSRTQKNEVKYTFVELFNLIDHIKPLNNKHGLVFTQIPQAQIRVDGSVDEHAIIYTMIVHPKSGQWVRGSLPAKGIVTFNKEGKPIITEGQARKGCITQDRRTMLCVLYGVAEGDDDGQSLLAEQQAAQEKENQRMQAEEKKKEDLKKKEEEAQKKKEDEAQKKKDEDSNPIRQLMALCKSNEIDVVEFTSLHKIKSDNPESVKHAVGNFNSLLKLFREKGNG